MQIQQKEKMKGGFKCLSKTNDLSNHTTTGIEDVSMSKIFWSITILLTLMIIGNEALSMGTAVLAAGYGLIKLFCVIGNETDGGERW